MKCAVEGRAATTVGLHIERRGFVEEVEYRAVHPEVLKECLLMQFQNINICFSYV